MYTKNEELAPHAVIISVMIPGWWLVLKNRVMTDIFTGRTGGTAFAGLKNAGDTPLCGLQSCWGIYVRAGKEMTALRVLLDMGHAWCMLTRMTYGGQRYCDSPSECEAGVYIFFCVILYVERAHHPSQNGGRIFARRHSAGVLDLNWDYESPNRLTSV